MSDPRLYMANLRPLIRKFDSGIAIDKKTNKVYWVGERNDTPTGLPTNFVLPLFGNVHLNTSISGATKK